MTLLTIPAFLAPASTTGVHLALQEDISWVGISVKGAVWNDE